MKLIHITRLARAASVAEDGQAVVGVLLHR
jgi:hypothetical protein